MIKLHELFALRVRPQHTPQSQPLPNSGQVVNNAGGYTWPVDMWMQLDRFLILGSTSGSYYVTPRQMTVTNMEAVIDCLHVDPQRAIARVVEISDSGRAPKNEPALFVLALAAAAPDVETRQLALAALPRVARTGTHLLHFLAHVEAMRGWGRALRKAVAAWYDDKPADRLAYQLVKYRQRDGWSHRDALRLAHPKPATAQHAALYHWVTQGWPEIGSEPHPDPALQLVWAQERAKRATTVDEIVALIGEYRLPWEAIPPEWLGERAVWQALLPQLPLTALVRQLARVTANGALKGGSHESRQIVARLNDRAQLHKARVHPIQLLMAQRTYAQGHGVQGNLTWQPVAAVTKALDAAFYKAFANVTPTGKRLLLALDVSGSMGWGQVAGAPGLTPRDASAALALVTAATEQHVTIVGFTDTLRPLPIRPTQSLDAAIAAISNLRFGTTDCAQPMIWAQQHKRPFDAFVVYTDNETWHGAIHPAEALRAYRAALRIPAKLVVVGMLANQFSIADPTDAGMMDVVGFDSAVPALIADFIRG